MENRAFQLKAVTWEWTGESDEDSLHEGFSAACAVGEPLSTEEALAQVECLAALGCESVCVSGGQTLHRCDWQTLAQALRQRNMRLALITDGYGVADAVDALGRFFDGVAITLEGPAAVHDKIKQKSGSFDRAVEALERLSAAGIYTGIVTTVSNHNINMMESLSHIVGEVGAKDWLIRTTFSSGAMRRPDSETYTIPPADIIFLIKYAEEFRRRLGIRVNAGCDIGYYAEEESIRLDPWSGCTAGIWTMAIEWNGSVKGCLSLPDELAEGNVRSRSLDSIWNGAESFSYNRHFDPGSMAGYCRVCPHSFSCGCGCPASAIASTGSRFDNIYCFQRLSKELQFIADHPEGGTSEASAVQVTNFTKDELFRIYLELCRKGPA